MPTWRQGQLQARTFRKSQFQLGGGKEGGKATDDVALQTLARHIRPAVQPSRPNGRALEAVEGVEPGEALGHVDGAERGRAFGECDGWPRLSPQTFSSAAISRETKSNRGRISHSGRGPCSFNPNGACLLTRLIAPGFRKAGWRRWSRSPVRGAE